MAASRNCDICERKITAENPIVAKLYFVPVRSAEGSLQRAGDYTHHADVGQCCVLKIRNMGWQKRVTRKENGQKKRLRSA